MRLGVRGPPQQPQRFHEDAHRQRIDLVAAVVPQALDHLADAGLGDDARLNAAAQPFQGAMEDAQGSPAQRRFGCNR